MNTFSLKVIACDRVFFDGRCEQVVLPLHDGEKAIQAELMKKTPRPAAGSEGTGGMDYAKKIEEAQASGNLTAVAYYTRLKDMKRLIGV